MVRTTYHLDSMNNFHEFPSDDTQSMYYLLIKLNFEVVTGVVRAQIPHLRSSNHLMRLTLVLLKTYRLDDIAKYSRSSLDDTSKSGCESMSETSIFGKYILPPNGHKVSDAMYKEKSGQPHIWESNSIQI